MKDLPHRRSFLCDNNPKMFKRLAIKKRIHKADIDRNRLIPEPHGVIGHRNIRYMNGYGKWHLLDVFRPANTRGVLPLIAVVHGGGWFYGDKEVYRLYAEDLAARGFAVISYNYVLAPKKKFPYPLLELDRVLSFAEDKADRYGFDLHNVFLAGDSSGAQMAAQYASIATNPSYKSLFSLQTRVKIRGLGLNCGLYCKLGADYSNLDRDSDLIWRWYLGKDYKKRSDPRYETLANMTKDFPPSYVLTSEKDFIKPMNKPLIERLTGLKIPFAFKEYVSQEGNRLQHVFHLVVNEGHAKKANDDECAFFRAHMEGR